MAGCFRRWDLRATAKKYVLALMSDLPRKNCWTIAEHAGDATPGKMQHLLERAKWDTMAAMAAVRGFVCERLDDGDAVAILDESGQCKKGTATIGVKRQYVGCAGRVENAINVVYCSFATVAGHALVGARPYLPAEWARDAERRQAAGVPDELEFSTKPELGRQILADLHAEGRLPGWVTGDEVYGRDPRLRAWLESPEVSTAYVLGISTSTRIALTPGKPTDPGLIHLTVTEVKRLVNLATRAWHSLEHHLHWHTWRRRHQARARWFHQRTRLTRR
ncbi:IS701 family transposase [Streptosporangium sp. 'caverna']|uniref:IS701 family transposase n=1 Tax=Streptosporangium sp. 'caverna' TaxID=2202249 RepID=UPI001EF76B6A|nr:IS701 family transposase [Streptosporangium sp. 'caverna']